MSNAQKARPAAAAKTKPAPSPFALSRIQAEGWKAARKYLSGGDPADAAAIAALNPYRDPVERARWYAGFNNAVETN